MLCMQSAARIICEPAARMYTKVGMFPPETAESMGKQASFADTAAQSW